jgi:hypothetical protein
MKRKLIAISLAAFGFLSGATPAQADLIICSGGTYCEEFRQQCLAEGNGQTYCYIEWRACVLDACPQ